jgi:peptide/nickel transport system substrate-binding protein
VKYFLIPLVIFLLSVLTFGCNTNIPTLTPDTSLKTSKPTENSAVATASTNLSQTKQQLGGTLKIILVSYPADFVTQTETTMPIQSKVSNAVWDPLLRVDSLGNWKPFLATNVTFASDLKSITLILRKGVKFQDGTDFNAEAVKYHIDNAKSRSSFNNIASIDIVDNYTLRINLSTFDISLLYNFLGGSGQVNSMQALQRPTTTANLRKDHISGTGPFSYVNWTQDVGLNLTRNNNYWDSGKPYLDAINFLYISDPVTAKMAFETGQAQVIRYITPADALDLKSKGYIIEFLDCNTINLVSDGGNADSPFASKNVRLAVEYALDKKSISDTFGKGFTVPLSEVCPPSITSGYNPALQARLFDAAKAKQLLADVGYPNGFDTTIFAQTSDNRNLLGAIQSNLEAVGIRAQIDVSNPAKFADLGGKGWHNGLMFWNTPANISYVTNLESTYGVKTQRFYSIFRPSGFEQSLTQALKEPDSAKRIPLTQNIVKIIYDEAMAVPVMTWPTISAMYKSVHDCNFTLVNSDLVWTPADAWLSK